MQIPKPKFPLSQEEKFFVGLVLFQLFLLLACLWVLV